MQRFRFSLRRMLVVVAVVALLLMVERAIYNFTMFAHTDASWFERMMGLAALNLMGFGLFGTVWLWHRFARYD